MSRRPTLAMLAAALVSITQIITISLLYISVDWYTDHAELAAVDILPEDAKSAWTSLNKGEMPDPNALAALVGLYPTLEEMTEDAPVAGVLGFGFALIVFTSVIGVLLAYRIVAPLSRLTAAAEQIRQGDFQVDVEPGATKEVETLATTINRMASELEWRINVCCRTGSLENMHGCFGFDAFVCCRTGSLEIFQVLLEIFGEVCCRTGSLERSRRLPR